MTEYASVEALTSQGALEQADVPVPGVGTVRVRALTRAEVLIGQTRNLSGPGYERYLIATGMVRPAMTENQVKAWQEASPAGQIEPVGRAIEALSRLGDGAPKEAYKSPGD